ncbi:hypothetical protein D3C87_1719900 [compost metagenome]
MLLLVFTHIDTGHHRIVVEQGFCKGFGQFGFTHTGCTQEDERADWFAFVLQTCPASANGICNCSNRLILSDYTFMQLFFQVQ